MVRVHSEEDVRSAFHGHMPAHVRLVARVGSDEELSGLYQAVRSVGGRMVSLKPASTPPCAATLVLSSTRLADLLAACACALEVDEDAVNG